MKKILSLCLFLLIFGFGQSQIKYSLSSQPHSINPGTLKSTQTLNAPITTVGSIISCPNVSFNIPITVSNFSNVGAITLRLDYDSTLLRFNSYSSPNPAFAGGLLVGSDFVSLTKKKIKIVWSSTTPISAITNLVTLNFTILTGSPTLKFNDTINDDCSYANALGDVFNDSPTATYYINPTITNLGPWIPGTISGSNPVYQNQSSISYTVQSIANATAYVWTLPSGASGSSTTSTISVNYGATAVSGNITVKGNNASCGDGPLKSLPIIVGNTIFTASSGDWNTSGNWDHGIPNATTNITIPALKSAIINTINDSCNNLTIAPLGQLTINSTKNLVVKGTLSLLSDTTGSASLIDYGTISATTIIAQRYITGNVFHQIGLPITSISAGSGAGQTGSVFLNCSIDKYNESNDTYTGLTSTSTITADRGYMAKYVFTPGSPAPTSKTLSFSGTLNNGTINIPMTKSGLGYNLIPNPYPSSIDWNASSGWTKNVDANNTIYIWNQGSTGDQWAQYNGVTGVNNGNRYIAPGQAFFIIAGSAGNLQMTNNVRTHNSTGFLKSTQTVVDNLIKLKVSGVNNQMADETAIYFSNNPVSPGSEKWFSFEPTAPSLYSLKNDVSYAINVLDDANSNIIVPLAFKAGIDGNYSLNAVEIGNFTLCSTILLEDNKTGLFQDLLNNPVYNFTASTIDSANRFLLHFEAAPNSIGKNSQSATTIYAYGNAIYVNSSENIQQITVFNLMGQMLKTISPSTTWQKINMSGCTKGNYIVKVLTSQNVYAKKVLLP